MKILVMSEMAAVEYVKQTKQNISIISITSTLEDDVVFKHNGTLKSIFRMKFNDILSTIDGFDAPKQSDFNGLKKFVDNLDCEVLIIHCFAGVSRSSAVAAAVMDYLKMEHNLFNSNEYEPNILVYKLAKNELK